MKSGQPFLSFVLAAILASACGSPPASDGRPSSLVDSVAAVDPQAAVQDVVARFGSKMRQVSVLAPDSIASARLQEVYGALVTPELLADWMSQPDSAPGRRVSSPWPDRIEVRAITPAGTDEFEVTGDVVYLTSAAKSGDRPSTEPARLHVRRTGDGSWRISAFTQGQPATPRG